MKVRRHYVDTSVILAFLLREISMLQLEGDGELVTSEISEIECRRTLDRIRISENLSDESVAERIEEMALLYRAINVIDLDKRILARAKMPFPTVVRTLDAIHIASADLAGADIFMSRDKQQIIAARGVGLVTSVVS